MKWILITYKIHNLKSNIKTKKVELAKVKFRLVHILLTDKCDYSGRYNL